MQRARSADAYHVERAMVLSNCAALEVDIGSCVELGDDDVDIVATHAGAEGCKTVTVIGACEGVYLAILAFEFYAVEDFLEHVDAVWVTNKEDVVGQILTGHINMV